MTHPDELSRLREENESDLIAAEEQAHALPITRPIPKHMKDIAALFEEIDRLRTTLSRAQSALASSRGEIVVLREALGPLLKRVTDKHMMEMP